MKNPTVGVIGMGLVGRNMAKIFPWAIKYDKYIESYAKNRSQINEVEFCFICVPTPPSPDGSCDVSMVEEVISWLEASFIIIKSTIAIGTTNYLAKKFGKRVCFSPEFTGATLHARPKNDFIILGGDREITSKVAQLYQYISDGSLRIRQTDAQTAELVKYMENASLACKVVFCNEIYRIAEVFGIDYSELRELFLLDSRQSASHTFVYQNAPFYDSKCLNKDLPALIACSKHAGFDPKFIGSIVQRNSEFRVK